MGGNNQPTDLAVIDSQIMQDNQSLRHQIEKLLTSMEASSAIEKVATLSLPLPLVESLSENVNVGDKQKVRMDKSNAMDSKIQRQGKDITRDQVYRDSSSFSNRTDQYFAKSADLSSSLQVLEAFAKKQIRKYTVIEDSLFMIPVFEQCVFGMTVANESDKKLALPKIRLRLIHRDASRCHSFLYDTQVFPNHKTVRLSSTCNSSILPIQDTFVLDLDPSCSVAPGSEIVITANFSYPLPFLEDDKLRLLVTLSLEGKDLWSKQIFISKRIFNGSVIDLQFKKHRLSVVRALGTEKQHFGMERVMVSEDNKYPKQSLERFLSALGFETVESLRTGVDRTVEFFTILQPSMLWGTCFTVESYMRKQTFSKCSVTIKTPEQMRYLQALFKDWLQREVQKDKRHGFDGLKLRPLNSISGTYINSKLEQEIQLILRLLDEKLVGITSWSRRSRGKTLMAETSAFDSAWLDDYCLHLEKTDDFFIKRMTF